MIATWFVMEDGSVADPSAVRRGADGVRRHADGRAVAMRGGVPRSRSVDVEMQANEIKPGNYLDREMKAGHPLDHDKDGRPGGASKPADTGDLAQLRSDYQAKFGKKPFAGWDAETLRAKLAAE